MEFPTPAYSAEPWDALREDLLSASPGASLRRRYAGPLVLGALSDNSRALIAFALLTFVAATVGGLASAKASDYYESLTLPAWAPPGWLFGVVWTPLYVLIAIAPWLVWRERLDHSVGTAIGFWAVQLVLNALWTWIFFAWERPAAALVEIMILFVAIALTIISFRPISTLAALLLVPYLVWVGFATALNYAIWR